MGHPTPHSLPKRYDGTPVSYLLPAGETLWRVHSRRYGPAQFNARGSDEHFGGGRFDSTPADEYEYLYAGLSPQTALAEAFLRGLPRDDRGYRHLRAREVRGRTISAVTVEKPLFLVSLLDGPALAAVAQEPWLVTAEGALYAQTRAVGHWIREQAEWAQGIVWQSLRDTSRPTLILFADRGAASALAPTPSRQIHLDDDAGTQWLRVALASYRVTLRRPPSGARPATGRGAA
ncbi:RES family NAD+ phosphorylase [Actinomadura fibrosa]|uniref:RES family NAD+ phosphorylase n=1 Tax=Actinomadura fibrosa TaxID=111802 RepID=A0ABW2XBB8_9ACTN|nr:RES family NAD+ phosphorylase [Actinomadura fibrosa]